MIGAVNSHGGVEAEPVDEGVAAASGVVPLETVVVRKAEGALGCGDASLFESVRGVRIVA